eukprot:m.932535 g.932535  ORF g.932535 m.932535 type:complete len:75 (-) comp23790_c1_seq4:405-629(-)
MTVVPVDANCNVCCSSKSRLVSNVSTQSLPTQSLPVIPKNIRANSAHSVRLTHVAYTHYNVSINRTEVLQHVAD